MKFSLCLRLQDVLHITGGLDVGAPDQPTVFENACNSARLHNLEHEVSSTSVFLPRICILC